MSDTRQDGDTQSRLLRFAAECIKMAMGHMRREAARTEARDAIDLCERLAAPLPGAAAPEAEVSMSRDAEDHLRRILADPDESSPGTTYTQFAREITRLRAKLRYLNRRCQRAEAGLAARLTSGPCLGRALANSAASMYREQNDDLRSRLTAAEAARDEARAGLAIAQATLAGVEAVIQRLRDARSDTP